MTPAGGIGIFNQIVFRILPLLASTCLKASIVFVYGTASVFINIHPKFKHLLWFTAISSYLLILVISFIGPGLPLERVRGPFETMEMYSDVPFSTVLQAAAPGQEETSRSAGPSGRTGGEDRSPSSGPSRGAPVWPFIALLICASGALASCLKIAVGRARAMRLSCKAYSRESPRHRYLLRHMLSNARIQRRVSLIPSAETTVPFTCRILKPVIVLPSSVGLWHEGRLRPVVLHELRQIKRWDLLTQSAALMICSLFWFVPFVWTAYSRLYLEQEKACEAGVVGDGVERAEYASCLLETARLMRKPALFTGLFFA